MTLVFKSISWFKLWHNPRINGKVWHQWCESLPFSKPWSNPGDQSSNRYLLAKNYRNRMCIKKSGATPRDAGSTQWTHNMLLSGSTVSSGEWNFCTELSTAGEVSENGFAARCLDTGFPSPSQRTLLCSPSRTEKLTFIFHCVWTFAHKAHRKAL